MTENQPVKLSGDFQSRFRNDFPKGITGAPQFALQMIQSIKADMDLGVVPVTVQTFSELHDFVDANEYLIEAYEASEEPLDAADQQKADRDNRAMEFVNVWLAAR